MLVLATPTNPGTAAFVATTALGSAVTQIASSSGQSVNSSTLAAQTLVSMPVAAGLMNAVGNTLRFWTTLKCSATDGVVTVTITYMLGGNTIATVGPTLPNATGKIQMLDITLRTVTAGAAGRLDAVGYVSGTIFGATANVNSLTPQVILSPVDLTAALDAQVLITFSAITVPATDNAVLNEVGLVQLGVA